VDARHFLGIEPEGDDLHWRLPVTPSISTPGRFLFGGCGLAAGIVALEAAAQRPVVWATAQYLAHAPIGSELRFDVVLAATGRRTTQARTTGRVGDDEVLTVNAALGQPDIRGDPGTSWVTAPDVPPPLQCPRRERLPFPEETVFQRVDQRLATGRLMAELDGTPGPATSASWLRVPGHLDPSAATLAVIGDYVTGGVSQAAGVPTFSRSLDNTIRVVRLVRSEWILSDIAIYGTVGGFAHGRAHLFAEDGTLMASASQSMSIRPWSGPQMATLRSRRERV
jgi:acyl-CoA thioesterase